MKQFELAMSAQKNIQDDCVLVITETWLNQIIPEEAFQLASRATHQAQHRTSNSGKSRGGGLHEYTSHS